MQYFSIKSRQLLLASIHSSRLPDGMGVKENLLRKGGFSRVNMSQNAHYPCLHDCASRLFLTGQGQQLFLRQNGDIQLHGFVQFAAGFFSGHHIRRFFGNAAADLSAKAFNQC